jgi:peptidoglycan/xylan/chitin deacetylase (PgdA/CDA1 family)
VAGNDDGQDPAMTGPRARPSGDTAFGGNGAVTGAGSPQRPPIPVLMYHQVDTKSVEAVAKYVVAPRAFGAQMRWLSVTGHTAVGMDALVANRTRGVPLPARPVVITLDDGFEACIEHAVPVLQSFGFTAIFYLVASGLTGLPSRWLLRERGVEFPLMSRESARQLVQGGFQVGAHTITHPRLTELSPDDCREELVRSRQILEDQLGTPVEHFAYPFGVYDEAVRAATIEAGYRSACSVRIGVSGADDDLFALHRVPVSGKDTIVDFIARLRNGRNGREQFNDLRRRAAGRVRRTMGRNG